MLYAQFACYGHVLKQLLRDWRGLFWTNDHVRKCDHPQPDGF